MCCDCREQKTATELLTEFVAERKSPIGKYPMPLPFPIATQALNVIADDLTYQLARADQENDRLRKRLDEMTLHNMEISNKHNIVADFVKWCVTADTSDPEVLAYLKARATKVLEAKGDRAANLPPQPKSLGDLNRAASQQPPLDTTDD